MARADALSPEAAVRFDRVSIVRGQVPVLENVTAQVPVRACTAVVGPNGAGKTSLLLALLGELSYRGAIRVSAGEKRSCIAYVPQSLDFDRGMPLTVSEFLAMGLQKRPLWLGVAAGLRDTIRSLLARVDARRLALRRLGALSGGEMQRVLLALALAREPDLLVLDEPAAGVDPHGEMLFCELLDSLRREHGFTQLMVTHDLGMVVHHADHVICLNRTVIAEGVPGRVLDGPTLLRLFGMHMGLMDAARLPACEHCRGGEPAPEAPCVPSGEQPRPPAGAGHGHI